jgi:hypothetical protein
MDKQVTMAKPRAGSMVSVLPTHDGNLIAKVAGFPDILFDRSKTSLECKHFAELKGWKFTLEDAAAKSRTEANGFKPSAEEKYMAIKALADHYMSGVTVWGRKAVGGAREDSGLVLMALMRVKGWDLDKANAWIARVALAEGIETKAVMANVAKNPDVVRAVGEIKAERAAKAAIDVSDLLGEYDGEEGDDEDAPE